MKKKVISDTKSKQKKPPTAGKSKGPSQAPSPSTISILNIIRENPNVPVEEKNLEEIEKEKRELGAIIQDKVIDDFEKKIY
jgi:hypothetical protein